MTQCAVRIVERVSNGERDAHGFVHGELGLAIEPGRSPRAPKPKLATRSVVWLPACAPGTCTNLLVQ